MRTYESAPDCPCGQRAPCASVHITAAVAAAAIIIINIIARRVRREVFAARLDGTGRTISFSRARGALRSCGRAVFGVLGMKREFISSSLRGQWNLTRR